MVEVDKKVKGTLVHFLEEWLRGITENLKLFIREIEHAKTVEELMEMKTLMVSWYLGHVPLSHEECYFCVLHGDIDKDCVVVAGVNCDACEYAVVHGQCGASGSDYMKILEKVRELRDMIENLYYKGEVYDDEE